MNQIAHPITAAPFWRRWTPLFVAGMAGVAALTPAITHILETAVSRAPNAPNLPMPALVAASIGQTALILGGAVAAGVAIAPRLGFRSHIVERFGLGQPSEPGLATEALLALAVGAIGGIGVIALDTALSRVTGVEILNMGQQLIATNTATDVLGRLLYGGITEELLMRWGLMSTLAWVGWKIAQRGQGAVSPAVVGTANVVTALLFGVGHLPAAATLLTLTPALVTQIVVLNASVGLGLGWLYARRSLEAAMLAHAMCHVVFVAAAGISG